MKTNEDLFSFHFDHFIKSYELTAIFGGANFGGCNGVGDGDMVTKTVVGR